RRLGPQDGAEAAWIAQPNQAVTQHQIEVVVFFRGRAVRQYAQAARHAEMQYQMAVTAIDQKVLPAPAYRLNLAPGEQSHCAWHGPTQPRLTHRDSRNHAAGEVRHEAAAGDFDFRKFGHAAVACAGHQIYLTSVEARC